MSLQDRPKYTTGAELPSCRAGDGESQPHASSARVLACAPAHGDRGVAPGPGLLELHFDRPMGAGMSLFGNVPEVTGRPLWDEARQVLRIPVRLEAGARYRLLLNAEPESGFQGADGTRLAPSEWEFSVR